MQKWEYLVMKRSEWGISSIEAAGLASVRGKIKNSTEEGWKADTTYWDDFVWEKDLAGASLHPQELLNLMGKKGWECFSVFGIYMTGGGTDYYFKRPLSD
jgi:hypothetical protein